MKEQFAWRHFYWYLTDKGIQYLHDYLHLHPRPKIVPVTLHHSQHESDRPRPKGLVSKLPARLTQGEADRDTSGRSSVPPGADKKAQEELSQQPNSSLEVNLVVDIVNHLSKFGGIVLC